MQLQLESMAALLSSGAYVNVQDAHGDVCAMGCLHRSISPAVALPFIRLLVEHGIDLNIFDHRSGQPPLHGALLMQLADPQELVLFMIEVGGADIYVTNCVGRNALGVCHMYQKNGIALAQKMVQAFEARQQTLAAKGTPAYDPVD